MTNILRAAALLLLSATSAAAIECRSAMPDHPSEHWTWRLIDGRKCWYAGEETVDKAHLSWPPARDPLGINDPDSAYNRTPVSRGGAYPEGIR